ncbi:Glycosyltransferase involved in cell wall bisynthesis [Zhouia amylolytica]|uniref:Glycosyltransferase involved in cell wall bisynthesis n=1 Tax=Zhouia amylolytica TaxID=376730 RepID=A0A1I6VKD7_9FLAO|nr:glycosyltransferase family 4 protein [Zhouia amylolytica]SFT14158.1 Glycosyltransferase involved in cell wall bisynthesis [Zhouia amylolytica]
MNPKKKLIRITTVPNSLGVLLRGQLKFMRDHFDVIGISSKGNKNRLKEIGKAEGIKTYAVEMTRKITPFKDIRSVYLLYKIFKKEKPFIVHSHTPKAGTVAMLAAKMAGVPHRLHTIAGLPLVEAKGFKRTLLNTVERFTYSCATKIYPNSTGLMDIVLEHGFTNEDKLKIIGKGSSNGIDTQYFDPLHYDEAFKNDLRNQLKIGANDFVFVFAGRLVRDKGINELVAAFNKLNKRYPKCKLLLLGSYEKKLDPLKPETESIIYTNDNIKFDGWKDDVRPYYAISNALVFPSYREGFPNVVLQATAMGLASIVSDINGCNEIITHDLNGLIIPVKDEQSIYFSMEYFLNHPEEVDRMAQNGRKHVLANYKQEYVWECLLNEYTSLENNYDHLMNTETDIN